MINQINPTPVVQESDEKQQAQHWHILGVDAEKMRSAGTFQQAHSWYELEKSAGYYQLGYQSIGEYVYDNFSKSVATARKYIDTHAKLVVNLGRSPEELAEIGAGKLFIAISHINEDNVDEMFGNLKKMSQKEISDAIRQESPEPEKVRKSITFKGPSPMIEAVESSLQIAKEEVCRISAFQTVEDVPDLSALEHICATWNGMVDLDGTPVNTLENALGSLEHAFNVKIAWTQNEEAKQCPEIINAELD